MRDPEWERPRLELLRRIRMRPVLSQPIEQGESQGFTPDAFVAVGGGTGTGSEIDPWSLAYALAGAGGQAAQKKIAVRGGTYDAGVGQWTLSSSASGVVGPGVNDPSGKTIFFHYPGERPQIINGSASLNYVLDCVGNYIWLEGMEVFDDGWVSRGGLYSTGHAGLFLRDGGASGCKALHCYFHDTVQAVLADVDPANAADFEMWGNVVRNMGFEGGAGGHGLYVHHAGAANAKLIFQRNLFGPAYSFGVQIYANTTLVDWIDFIENAIWGAGALAIAIPNRLRTLLLGGAGNAAHNCQVLKNMLYRVDAGGGQYDIGFDNTGDQSDLTIEDNYAVGGGTGEGAMRLRAPVNPQSSVAIRRNFTRVASGKRMLEVTDAGALAYVTSLNEWVGLAPTVTEWRHAGVAKNFATFQTDTTKFSDDIATATLPTTARVFVLSTEKYGSGRRGNVIIYNWPLGSSVSVDLSPILQPGDNYKVWDHRDLDGWWGESGGAGHILSGTYTGGSVSFPMDTQKADPTPIGAGGDGSWTDPPNTVPFFNAFVVRKV